MTPSQPHSLREPLMAGLELGAAGAARPRPSLCAPWAVAVRSVYVSLAPTLVVLKRAGAENTTARARGRVNVSGTTLTPLGFSDLSMLSVEAFTLQSCSSSQPRLISKAFIREKREGLEVLAVVNPTCHASLQGRTG